MIDSLMLLDAALCLTLATVAAGALWARDLFRAIVLFIVFGLLLAVAWCRLEAVDVALAEAAIGAGLTGALLLNTWAATCQPARSVAMPVVSSSFRLIIVLPPIVAGLLILGGMSAMVVPLSLATDAPRISLTAALPDSGVGNPVTAVLLNFRGYDTLLEIAVLFAAMLAVIPLTTATADLPRAASVGPVLTAFTRVMIPAALLVAVYVLWAGTKSPGGAFQAAALLAAAGVLQIVCGWPAPPGANRRWRLLIAGGLAVFLAVAVIGVAGGGRVLQYHGAWATFSIVLIETALTVSLALILIRLFRSTAAAESCLAEASESSRMAPATTQEQP